MLLPAVFRSFVRSPPTVHHVQKKKQSSLLYTPIPKTYTVCLSLSIQFDWTKLENRLFLYVICFYLPQFTEKPQIIPLTLYCAVHSILHLSFTCIELSHERPILLLSVIPSNEMIFYSIYENIIIYRNCCGIFWEHIYRVWCLFRIGWMLCNVCQTKHHKCACYFCIEDVASFGGSAHTPHTLKEFICIM